MKSSLLFVGVIAIANGQSGDDGGFQYPLNNVETIVISIGGIVLIILFVLWIIFCCKIFGIQKDSNTQLKLADQQHERRLAQAMRHRNRQRTEMRNIQRAVENSLDDGQQTEITDAESIEGVTVDDNDDWFFDTGYYKTQQQQQQQPQRQQQRQQTPPHHSNESPPPFNSVLPFDEQAPVYSSSKNPPFTQRQRMLNTFQNIPDIVIDNEEDNDGANGIDNLPIIRGGEGVNTTITESRNTRDVNDMNEALMNWYGQDDNTGMGHRMEHNRSTGMGHRMEHEMGHTMEHNRSTGMGHRMEHNGSTGMGHRMEHDGSTGMGHRMEHDRSTGMGHRMEHDRSTGMGHRMEHEMGHTMEHDRSTGMGHRMEHDWSTGMRYHQYDDDVTNEQIDSPDHMIQMPYYNNTGGAVYQISSSSEDDDSDYSDSSSLGSSSSSINIDELISRRLTHVPKIGMVTMDSMPAQVGMTRPAVPSQNRSNPYFQRFDQRLRVPVYPSSKRNIPQYRVPGGTANIPYGQHPLSQSHNSNR